MNNNEKKISAYIDKLNAEQKPFEHGNPSVSQEFKRLSDTVRQVRMIKEPVLPDAGYPKQLAGYVIRRISKKPSACKTKRVWFTGAAIASILVLAIALSFIAPLIGTTNVVYAMEKAYENVKAYHGIMEIVLKNEKGEEFTQARREVWADNDGRYFINELDGYNRGFITVNNGEKKWQIRPDEEKVYLFQAFPDPYRFTLDIGNEVRNVKTSARVTITGEEIIAGRMATILEVLPQGGQIYKIWIDKETRLPLQKQSAMQNALQYKVTYTEIELITTIADDVMEYRIPQGYTEEQSNPEQMVNTVEEAEMLAGFIPIIPEILPEGYKFDGISISTEKMVTKTHYTSIENQKKVIILQGKVKDELKPAVSAILGKIGENPAEILSPVSEAYGVLSVGLYSGITDIKSIRWQDTEFEYAVVGDTSLDELLSFTEKITGRSVQIPEENAENEFKPLIEVPVNIEVEQNEQKSVDGGHAPWRLDPAFVAQVFVSLEMSPGGIEGDYPVSYEHLTVIYNDGVKAIVEVKGETPVRKVYLKRLVRQDSTGIWTVVGYDPN